MNNLHNSLVTLDINGVPCSVNTSFVISTQLNTWTSSLAIVLAYARDWLQDIVWHSPVLPVCADGPGQTLILIPPDLCQFFQKALQLLVTIPADCENGAMAQNTDTLGMTLEYFLTSACNSDQKNLWVILSSVFSISCPPSTLPRAKSNTIRRWGLGTSSCSTPPPLLYHLIQ